ncbi:MAG: nuclear transport factor 2 family protein [Actinomycetota bacterium]|nr:nuclear transport factor 2 family protein [Actinomycetota bacterium]
MASPNLDLVRSIYAAWERGDWGLLEWAHPEIEFVFADGPEPGIWTGREAMADAWRNFLAAWEDLRAEAEEYREIDSERILVLAHNSGRGRTSGLQLAQMQTRAANVFHLRDSKVTRFVLYWDRDRAFADLGLSSEGNAAGTPG